MYGPPMSGTEVVGAHHVAIATIGRPQGDDGGFIDDTQRRVGQEDVDDLKGCIAVDEQPRGIVACVAGKVEARPGAPSGSADTKGVRHAHVAAGGAAVGQPYRRRSHRRQ